MAQDLAPSSETPMSAHSTSFKDVAAEEMNLLSEEPASRSTSATAVSEAPQTSYQLRSTTEEVFQDAGGNKVRGPRGRFMTWEEACQSTSSAESKPAKKRLCKHLNNLWCFIAILTFVSKVRQEESSESERR
jgi:hypothetical protein